MKRNFFAISIIALSLVLLMSCEKEIVKQGSSPEPVSVQEKGFYFDGTGCHFTPLAYSGWAYMGYKLFGTTQPAYPNANGDIDKYLNCPTEHGDLCDYISVPNIATGIVYQQSDPSVPLNGGMTVAEQELVASQVAAACSTYLATNYSSQYIVTEYRTSCEWNAGFSDFVVYVEFDAAKPCR